MIATLTAIVNPGDEVIVFEPYYENYGPDSILSGATPRYVTLHAPDWHFDPKELARAFNKKSKAIIINTPNNPTGKVFSKEELTYIASLCQKWDVLAVTDEIYEHILYDNKKHISIASLPGMKNRTVTINSISKTYSVTGWRVGWAIASPLITKRIRKVHDFMTVGAPTPLQHAAAFALTLPQSYYDTLLERYQKNKFFLFQVLQKAGFTVSLPEGAYYMLADISEFKKRLKVQDDVSFSRKLIECAKVATVPGSSFYSDKKKGRNQVRFCFCKSMQTLSNVQENLKRFF
jgi:aminotransferase